MHPDSLPFSGPVGQRWPRPRSWSPLVGQIIPRWRRYPPLKLFPGPAVYIGGTVYTIAEPNRYCGLDVYPSTSVYGQFPFEFTSQQ